MKTKFRKINTLLSLGAFALTVGVTAFSADAQQIVPHEQTVAVQADGGKTAGKASTKESASPQAPSSGGYDWTGAYAGANIGYGWGSADTRVNPLPSATQFINLAPTTLEVKPRGVIGGVQGGYNWQHGHFVIGGEADIKFSGMKEDVTVSPIIQNNGTPFLGGGSISSSQKIKWLGTVRPRAGAAFGRFFVYGTAGLAYGRIESSADTDFRPFGTVHYPAVDERTKAGWTAGAGVEIGVSRRVSIKSEYLYVDLGTTRTVANPTVSLPPFQIQYDWKTKANTWTTGVNFRF